MVGIHDDTAKLRVFPSLITGDKSTFAQSELRACSTWNEMMEKFTELFALDKHAVLIDLQALNVKDWDLDAYNSQFNRIASRYHWTKADQDNLKEAYTRSLPFKCKEKMLIDRDYHGMTLT